MDQKTAGKLLEENLHTLFAWSLARLYDKGEAEDFVQDVICAVLESVHRLKNDDAFFGFMWRIAEHILAAKLRRKHPESMAFDETYCGTYWESPENNVIHAEEINLLRRELSLLSSQYRESTVLYYIHGKNCSEISAELNISVEMVKYYLFKTRKILKEGIGMTREFGEKSYDPSVFRMDFWGGGDNRIYWDIFKRRLPGNILLAAYDKPVTITELSVELGVAAVYLEDEIEILKQHDLIRKTGGKYQTDIIIFTAEYEKHVLEKFRPVYEHSAERINCLLDEIVPELKTHAFHGNNYDPNRLKWTFANIAMYHALQKSDQEGRERYGSYPLLSNGSYGFIFGYDNDYETHHFNGIYSYCENAEKTAWVSVENYRIIETCQNLQLSHWEKSISALTDAVLFRNADGDNDELIRLIGEGAISSDHGSLSPNFPVFTEKVFEQIREALLPVIDEICRCMSTICGIAAETLKDYIPKALGDKCGQLTWIHHQMDVMAFLMETMVEKGQLSIPDVTVPLCVFGIDMEKETL